MKKQNELALILVVVPRETDSSKLESSKIQSRSSALYSDNWESIFGKKDASALN